ncbi:hypothetical protein NDU88_003640 [Pleurodeles waltl]|uniref:Uncharacterized protein n=1 Tax=Pleurodeles waltl TaxID=8319 RepID=A0AAV7SGH7_PLEWA|nr:hypothetical protein NDU88_003640 [Pleurodeles waltl]
MLLKGPEPRSLRRMWDPAAEASGDSWTPLKVLQRSGLDRLRDLDLVYGLMFLARLRVQYSGKAHFFDSPEAAKDWIEMLGGTKAAGILSAVYLGEIDGYGSIGSVRVPLVLLHWHDAGLPVNCGVEEEASTSLGRVSSVPLWRTRAEALTDTVFAQIVSEILDHYCDENWESAGAWATVWDAMKVVLGMKALYGVKMQLTLMLDLHEKKMKVPEDQLTGSPHNLGEWKDVKRELLKA